MAAPVDAAQATTNITTAASPWPTVNLPAGISAGDFLVMAISASGDREVTAVGWDEVAFDDTDPSNSAITVLTRVADGSEGATMGVTPQGGTSKGGVIVWRITGARTSGTIVTVQKTASQSTNADPPSATTDGGVSSDVLAIAILKLSGETGTQSISASPSTYGTLRSANSGTGGAPSANNMLGGATKQLTGVTSEDPGAFTNSAPATASGNTTVTVLVHAPGAVTSTKSGIAASDETASGADVFTAAETGLTVSAMVSSGADSFNAAETGSGVSARAASGTKVVEKAKTGAGVAAFVASGADAPIWSDTGSGVSARSASGADAVTVTETGTTISVFTASGADASTSAETGAGVAPFTASGPKIGQKANVGAGVSVFVGAGVDAATFAETGAGVSPRVASGTKTFTSGKSGAGVSPRVASGADVAAFTETGVGTAPFSGGGDGYAPGYASPDADLSTGTWTVVPLYPKVDETLVANDGDFITSGVSPASPDVAELNLSDVPNPVRDDFHEVTYRVGKDSAGGDNLQITVRFMQGATEVASWVHAVPDSLTTYVQTLTDEEAATITDYTDLRIKLEAVKV